MRNLWNLDKNTLFIRKTYSDISLELGQNTFLLGAYSEISLEPIVEIPLERGQKYSFY